jgi:transposase-like protein
MHTPEQIVNILRQIEVANGKTQPVACREAGLTAQTFYRWRKEYGDLEADQAKQPPYACLAVSAGPSVSKVCHRQGNGQ